MQVPKSIVWFPVLAGASVSLLGVVLLFQRPDADVSAAVIVCAGLVFSALPFLTTASAGKDGVSIATIFADKAAEAVESNAKAITELRSAITALEARLSNPPAADGAPAVVQAVPLNDNLTSAAELTSQAVAAAAALRTLGVGAAAFWNR